MADAPRRERFYQSDRAILVLGLGVVVVTVAGMALTRTPDRAESIAIAGVIFYTVAAPGLALVSRSFLTRVVAAVGLWPLVLFMVKGLAESLGLNFDGSRLLYYSFGTLAVSVGLVVVAKIVASLLNLMSRRR